tara:strand:- start:1523 stop:2089 length:567 start_codon:yes stop_codon:yes gene_type:complete
MPSDRSPPDPLTQRPIPEAYFILCLPVHNETRFDPHPTPMPSTPTNAMTDRLQPRDPWDAPLHPKDVFFDLPAWEAVAPGEFLAPSPQLEAIDGFQSVESIEVDSARLRGCRAPVKRIENRLQSGLRNTIINGQQIFHGRTPFRNTTETDSLEAFLRWKTKAVTLKRTDSRFWVTKGQTLSPPDSSPG